MDVCVTEATRVVEGAAELNVVHELGEDRPDVRAFAVVAGPTERAAGLAECVGETRVGAAVDGQVGNGQSFGSSFSAAELMQ